MHPSSPYETVFALLPKAVQEQIRRIAAGCFGFENRLSEIRLRADRIASLTLDGKNVPLSVSVSKAELAQLLHTCCQGSVYAYGESLREGYVAFGACRVGVAGRAVLSDGMISGIDDPVSLVFRIPHHVPGAGDAAMQVWRHTGGKEGILVYSLPGIGKTTLLRDFAVQLSCGASARRVAIVDCRGEFGGTFIAKNCLADILTDYPKAEGIEIAVRTLSPEAVICDEIGSFDEAESILSVQSCGVPLIASAHAESYASLMRRSAVRMLTECGVFGAFLGIRRTPDGYAYQADYLTQPDKTG